MRATLEQLQGQAVQANVIPGSPQVYLLVTVTDDALVLQPGEMVPDTDSESSKYWRTPTPPKKLVWDTGIQITWSMRYVVSCIESGDEPPTVVLTGHPTQAGGTGTATSGGFFGFSIPIG